LNTHAAIFVCECEDLLDQQQREIDTFQIDFQWGIGFERQTVDLYPLSIPFGWQTECHFTVGLEGHDKVFVQVMLDEHHILGGAIPDITQDVLEGDLVVAGMGQQVAIIFIFTDRRTALPFAILLVDVVFRPGDHAEANRQRVPTGMIQTRHEIDAFDAAVLAVVIMPADDFVLVGIRLFSDTIVNDEHPIVLLDLAHIRFDDLPQIGTTRRLLDLVMADAPAQQTRQAHRRRFSESADQIVTIDVEQFTVFHLVSLAHSAA